MLARSLDALSLGEDAATALGVRVGHTRLGLVAVATVLAAVAVAATGPVGFVAFIASHIARRLADRTGGAVLPVAALSGAVLVLMADLVAGLVLAPTQLPAGIVTSVLGAPYSCSCSSAPTARARRPEVGAGAFVPARRLRVEATRPVTLARFSEAEGR